MPQRQFSPRRAFTLIEILIVLAILGILAAILLPVFNSAREGARRATCSSNLKQIALSTRLYMNDSNGAYPIVPTAPCGWASVVYPYVSSAAVFKCPNFDRGEFKTGCPPDTVSTQTYSWDGSYDYNPLRAGERGYIRESSVGRPSEVGLFIDGEGGLVQNWRQTLQEWGLHIESLTERGDIRHPGGLNVCFADGHVKWLNTDALLQRSLWLNDRDAEWGKPWPTS